MVDDETDAVLAAWDRTTSRLADEIRGMRYAVERLTLERAVRRPAEPESPEEHRLLYRARQIPGFIGGYRAEYDRNKWWADAFQNAVIVGSVVVTLTFSAAGFVDRLRWVAASASGVVAIAAGLAAHYKFRERAANAHCTADGDRVTLDRVAAYGAPSPRGHPPFSDGASTKPEGITPGPGRFQL